MPLEQYSFGVGGLFAVRTDLAVPTPVRFGTVQEISVDLSYTVKELYGQYQAPVAVARGQQKITGKAKSAKLNARQFNEIFFGQTLATGSKIEVMDEGGPSGTAIPGTPYQIVVANGTSMSAGNPGTDLGVFNAATGIQLTRVASAPTAGQYAADMTTGTYAFSAADSTGGVKVILSYAYQQGTTGGRITAYNQLMGSGPVFQMVLGNSFLGNKSSLTLYQCIATKLSMGFKNEDFEIPEFEFSAFADSLGRYYDWSSDLV